MKKLLFLTLLLTASASAQQPSEAELSALIQTLSAQRNAASDQVAQAAMQIAKLKAELEAAQKSCKAPGK